MSGLEKTYTSTNTIIDTCFPNTTNKDFRKSVSLVNDGIRNSSKACLEAKFCLDLIVAQGNSLYIDATVLYPTENSFTALFLEGEGVEVAEMELRKLHKSMKDNPLISEWNKARLILASDSDSFVFSYYWDSDYEWLENNYLGDPSKLVPSNIPARQIMLWEGLPDFYPRFWDHDECGEKTSSNTVRAESSGGIA